MRLPLSLLVLTLLGCSVRSGDAGSNGASVAITALSIGDETCPAGGSRLQSMSAVGNVCNGVQGPPGPPGPPGAAPAPSTRYLSIAAGSCAPQQPLPATGSGGPWVSGGLWTRTNGNSTMPDGVGSQPTSALDTYVCALPLPSGAIIEQIVAYGEDSSVTGYMEAAVWRVPHGSFGPQGISGFGTTWQSTGIAAAPNFTSFEIFSLSDPPHTVDPAYSYVIGYGLTSPGAIAGVVAYSFQVRYRDP